VFIAVVACLGQTTAVLTGGYDPARTNADLTETLLTPGTVNPNQFGRLFFLPADGQIYAQPLYQPNLPIAGQGVHNVVFFATAHNSVYAYDADTAAPPLWTVNLGPSVPSSAYGTAYTDISPEIGIIGTPVIDPSTGTLYAVAATLENGNYFYRLHALDTSSGAEKFGAPAVIAAAVAGSGVDNVNGVVSFNALQHIQRPALLLMNGVVYVAFGSHGDDPPWHGWIMGYSAANVQNQTAVFNTTPNGNGGSVWNSGRGLSADSQGNIYVVTANGDTDEITEFSDNVLRLRPADLTVTDWFAPSDVQTLDEDDDDLGASGAVLIPGTSFLLTGGKQAIAYLLDQSSLGHMNSTNSQIPETFGADSAIFNMTVWTRSTGPVVYFPGAASPVEAFSFTANRFDVNPSSLSSSVNALPYDGMTVSANGGNPGSGILWVTTADSWSFPATGTLHAFNADSLSSELWNSSMNVGRDALGAFTKFANPTVANGKVYVPTSSGALAVYGKIAAEGGSAPVITGLVNAASYANGSVAPGEIVNIFGQNLGPQALVTGSVNGNGKLSTGIGGAQVTFNGIAAPLLYASGFATAAIVPFEVAGANEVTAQISYNGSTSAVQTFHVAASAPGIFTADSSGSGEAAVLNQDSSVNSDANPASQGSVVSVYATGGGQTTPPVSTGSTVEYTAQVAASVSATIGGQPAQVIYAGQAPGEVAGVMQVNLQVPNGVTGDLAVILTVGGVASQTTATVAVQ
jgi:uncharacterized protein (TIGR03437 family)